MKRIALAKNRKKSDLKWSDFSEAMQASILKRIHLPLDAKPSFIKAGSKGSVFKLPNDQVLKITRDETEAKAAAIIKSNPSKYIYTVYDVFQLDTDPVYFCLLLKDLNQPEPEWIEFGDIFNTWHSDVSDILEARKGSDYRPIYILKPVVKVFSDFIHTNYGDKYDQQLQWLDNISQYLFNNRILYLDLHGGNIMKDPDTDAHVLIDLGYSKVPDIGFDLITEDKSVALAKRFILMAKMLSKINLDNSPYLDINR